MFIVMKHFICITFVLLPLVNMLHAQEVPFIELKGHTYFVRSACFSPDGTKVLTTSGNNARIWDTQSGKELHIIQGYKDSESLSAHFSPDGKQIVISEIPYGMWDTVHLRPGARREIIVRLLDADTGKELQKLDDINRIVALSVFSRFSPDKKKIVTTSSDGTAKILDAETQKELQKLVGHAKEACFATFSPDGKKIVTTSYDHTARIWDTESGKELQKLEGHTSVVWSAAFSADGKKVVTAGANKDNTARIWDVETGKELQKLEGHTYNIDTAGFSPDGKKVVTGSRDNTVRIWDVESGKELQKMEGWHASFSPDRKKFVTPCMDYTARIWTME
jgi:WD40 repeat protein